MSRVWKIAPLLLALAACSDDPELDGSWSGAVQDATMTLTLAEDDDGGISGSGNLSVPGGSAIALTVTGTHAHPAVSMNFSAEGFESFNFSGTLETDDMMSGTLNGSGFQNETVTLTRSGAN